MGKDKRTFRTKGVTLFKGGKEHGQSDNNVLYILAFANLYKNVAGVKRPSKRAINSQKWLSDYLESVSSGNK